MDRLLQIVDRGARQLGGRLPEPAQRVLRDIVDRVGVDRVGVTRQPEAVTITYPADVADEEAVRTRLAQTDLFADPAEGQGYLADAVKRFRITVALLPELDRGARVLELGSNPYFITRLLRERGLAVTSANWFGADSGFEAAGAQTVTESGVAHEYRFDHFNLEVDSFPYEDATFDVVLFCEILEHLPFDPVHSLAEIHRVLKPGGAVLITTPNALRTENVIKMLQGTNVYEVLSGHGTYGRHNREYTVEELRTLLRLEGFATEFVIAIDIHSSTPTLPRCHHMSRDDRGENLFALARSVGDPRWRYPEWLYSSRHALRRIVRPDVRMGCNDELQTSGLHGLEDDTVRPYRWTGPDEALVSLRNEFDTGRIRIEGFAPTAAAGGALRLWASAGPQTVSWPVSCNGAAFVVESDIDAARGPLELRVGASPTWRPVDAGDGRDDRQLGVALTRIAMVESASGGDGGG